MTWFTCPTCQRRFDSQQSEALPFCGDRCRLVDLHRWLSEAYSLPVPREESDDMAEGWEEQNDDAS